mgnify:CR=1 FL=1|jgi:uncharacterized membrane protein YecN with MAPEG domain
MSNEIIVAIITGLFTFAGVVVTNIVSNKKVQYQLHEQQKITDVKLEELTREVRKHNNFAERVPVIEEQIKVINHRIDDLERK